MIKVYSMSVEPLYDESICKAACDKLDTSRLEKVNGAKRTEDKILRVGAGLLLQYAVQEGSVFDYKQDAQYFSEVSVNQVLGGIREPIEFEFLYGPHGKPYFKENCLKEKCDLFFSLSHSGEYVLCALSDVEIGADIQKIPENAPEKIRREEQIAGKFFSELETIWYQQCEENGRRERFYRLWAAKEAYMKLTGKGLSQGLDSFTADLEKNLVVESGTLTKKADLYEIAAPAGYTAAVSTKI